MATINASCVHIKRSHLAFPELYENGTMSEDGSARVNKVSFIIDTTGDDFFQMAVSFDEAVKAATLKEFGTDHVEYDKTPITPGEEIKGRNGKPSNRMKGKISVVATSIQRPGLYKFKKGDQDRSDIGIDHDYFYAGAEVYGIIEFVARRAGGKKYLNAHLRGILHTAHSTPFEGTPVTIATAAEFEIDAA